MSASSNKARCLRSMLIPANCCSRKKAPWRSARMDMAAPWPHWRDKGAWTMPQARGIKHLAYFQVDNPLVSLCDPTLIGHHLLSASEMTTQVVRKRYPMEKVGNVVAVDGKVQIIEYSDLPQEAAEATGREWTDPVMGRQYRRPCDRLGIRTADESVSGCVTVSSCQQESRIRRYERARWSSQRQPNAIKFERFIFDLLPFAENAFVVESLPSEAFAPVKNADGAAADTPELARQAIVNFHRSWLQAAGVQVESAVQVEINPQIFVISGRSGRKDLAKSENHVGPLFRTLSRLWEVGE